MTLAKMAALVKFHLSLKHEQKREQIYLTLDHKNAKTSPVILMMYAHHLRMFFAKGYLCNTLL